MKLTILIHQFLKQEENNYNEQNAIQNFTNKWNNLTKQKLDGVSNIGVRNRIKQNLDLEYGDYVYNIKKQSFKALETESTNTYNSEENLGISPDQIITQFEGERKIQEKMDWRTN